MKRLLVPLLTLCLSLFWGCRARDEDSQVSIPTSVTSSQPLLFSISVEGKWGYIDTEGSIVIEPQFLKVSEFSEGLAVATVAGTSEEDRVFKRTYQGFISPNGEFVIPPEPPTAVRKIENFSTYSYSDFHEGLAKIHINDSSGMDGYIDRTGELVIAAHFDTPAEFSEGMAFATTWLRWDDDGPKKAGFIDKRGNFVIRNDAFQFGHIFSGGCAVVSVLTDENDWACGLIDDRGKFIVPPGVYSALSTPVNGAIRAVKQGKVGLIDTDGKEIVPLGKYDQVLQPLKGDVFTAESNGKAVLIDATGKLLANVAEPGDVGAFCGGMATIERNGRYGYIDVTGAVRIALQFDDAQPFDRGLALVEIGKTKGYINSQGEFVWKTDCWDEPLRNSVSKPLATFLPETTLKALPLSYNWERVKNAIVFVADGDFDDLQSFYKKRCSGQFKLKDNTDVEREFAKLEMTIYRSSASFLEVYAMAGTADKETVDGFVEFYACSNMFKLRSQYPKKFIGILIEN